MTKFTKLLARVLFTAAYAALISFAMSCFMHLPSLSFVSSWTGVSYPRLIFFCYAVPILASVALICLLILNIKLSDRLSYTSDTWLGQTVCAFVISIPTIQLWSDLILFLHKTL